MEYLKYLYNTYLHQTLVHKIFQSLVLIAMFTSISAFIFRFTGLFPTYVYYVSEFAIIILLIFIIELTFDYLYHMDSKEFFKHEWLDFVLIVILSFLFFTSFLIAAFWAYTKDIKNMRLIQRLFK